VSESLTVQLLGSCTPDRFGRVGAGLLAQVESDRTPRLVIAALSGESVLLGRHQRASSALELIQVQEAGLPISRRLGGGRAFRVGEGQVGILLAVPELGSLLQAPIGPTKLINRYIRGLNVGLALVGAGSGAHYFGRDFISAEGRQIAAVSQDGSPAGAGIFEAIVAVSRSLELPSALRGYPEHGDPRADGPPFGTLSELWSRPHSFDEIAEAVITGYQRALGCTIERADASAPVPEAALFPMALEEEEGLEDSGVTDIPIGFAEALVRRPLEPITEVRLRGDFIAPSFVLEDLQRELVGKNLVFEELGLVVDEAFRRPNAGILGVRTMRFFPDAILAASGRL